MRRNLQLSHLLKLVITRRQEFLFFFKHKHMFAAGMSQFFLSNICYRISPEIREEQRRRPSVGRGVSRIQCGRGRMLHRWGGVAHHRVVVRRRAVALQAGVQGRVVQTEVQRRDHGRELVPVRVAPHRLFALTRRLHPEKQKDYLSYVNSISFLFNFSLLLLFH